MKYILSFILFCLVLFPGELPAQQKYLNVHEKLPEHPRLLLFKGEEKNLKKQINRDAIWKEIHQKILDESDKILTLPVNERIKTGMRLLAISRDNMNRIFLLSYSYRMTGNKKYARRAEAEMLKAASFSDWNPSHFLDVAEMTMGLAIGYDWLYACLPQRSRQIIEKAIIEKGIKPSYDKSYNWFVNAQHNWNQVCHGGISFGALAVWEKDSDLACKTINRAIEKIALPMKHYSPDGAYPEGINYWGYGTSYNAIFLSAVEKIFKTDFGLCKIPGFLKTGEYLLHGITPSLVTFSYSDNSSQPELTATPFWFYNKTKDASILYNQIRLYKKYGLNPMPRFVPAMIIWGASAPVSKPQRPAQIYWKANGDNPIVCMRSDWNSDKAAFLGVKLGSPKINHGHMDIGSFVYESDGVRWIVDLGGENYNRLETRGVKLWDMSQNSQRWDVFRYNNLAHSTLTFNKKHQSVDGKAEILKYSDNPSHMYVVSDLTPVYKNQVKSAVRSFSLINKKQVVIEDKITTSKQFTMMTWTFVTPAKVSVLSDKKLVLEKDGKKLYLNMEGMDEAKWNVKPAVSDFSYDSPNEGISIVSFQVDLKLNSEQKVQVKMSPSADEEVPYQSVL